MSDSHGGLPEIAGAFLRLGVFGFGGPVAHVAMMQDEFVERRGWIDRNTFVDALAATNLVPGPNSTEMAIHLGYRRGRTAGAVIAGVAFILPAMVSVLALAWAYVRWGTVPSVTHVFRGIQPAVLAIVVLAAWRLRAAAQRSPLTAALTVVAFATAVIAPAWELLVMLGAGGVMILARTSRASMVRVLGGPLAFVLPGIAAPSVVIAIGSASLVSIAITFLKVGSLLFGGGYVMIPLLKPDVIGAGWVTEQQFLDGLAIGQATPGPIVITATFIGYLAAGWAGAIVATLAIFLPSFVFAIGLGRLMPMLTQRPPARAFLDGVSAAVVGGIAGAAITLGAALDWSPVSLVIGIGSAYVLWRGLAPAYAVIAATGVLGLALGARF